MHPHLPFLYDFGEGLRKCALLAAFLITSKEFRSKANSLSKSQSTSTCDGNFDANCKYPLFAAKLHDSFYVRNKTRRVNSWRYPKFICFPSWKCSSSDVQSWYRMGSHLKRPPKRVGLLNFSLINALPLHFVPFRVTFRAHKSSQKLLALFEGAFQSSAKAFLPLWA